MVLLFLGSNSDWRFNGKIHPWIRSHCCVSSICEAQRVPLRQHKLFLRVPNFPQLATSASTSVSEFLFFPKWLSTTGREWGGACCTRLHSKRRIMRFALHCGLLRLLSAEKSVSALDRLNARCKTVSQSFKVFDTKSRCSGPELQPRTRHYIIKTTKSAQEKQVMSPNSRMSFFVLTVRYDWKFKALHFLRLSSRKRSSINSFTKCPKTRCSHSSEQSL